MKILLKKHLFEEDGKLSLESRIILKLDVA
jgi:hypothetical protein